MSKKVSAHVKVVDYKGVSSVFPHEGGMAAWVTCRNPDNGQNINLGVEAHQAWRLLEDLQILFACTPDLLNALEGETRKKAEALADAFDSDNYDFDVEIE